VKNTLTDLNNYLFAELERLDDESVKGNDLTEEITRAKAITGVATQIISNGSLALQAKEFIQEYGSGDGKDDKKMPPMLREAFLGE
jgi:hypothetical protein